jgi:hypothetical protein
MKRKLLGIACVSALAGCASLEKGIPGFTQYMQFVIDGEVVWEHAIGAGSVGCDQNVANNNRELEITKESQGRYRCSSQPAPESVLPYSYVSSFERVIPGGLAYNAPMVTRFPTPENCWASLERLKDNERVLKRENCGPKPVPRVRPGERAA